MTVKIDADVVKHVAGLAHLELSDDEVGYYEKQLSRVLDHMAQLASLPSPPAVANPGPPEVTPEREDRVLPSLSVEEALSQAPRRGDSAFLVPRIIE